MWVTPPRARRDTVRQQRAAPARAVVPLIGQAGAFGANRELSGVTGQIMMLMAGHRPGGPTAEA